MNHAIVRPQSFVHDTDNLDAFVRQPRARRLNWQLVLVAYTLSRLMLEWCLIMRKKKMKKKKKEGIGYLLFKRFQRSYKSFA